MFDTRFFRASLVVFGALVTLCTYLLFPQHDYWVPVATAAVVAIVVGKYRGNYLHPAVVFCLPWLMVLIFSAMPISLVHQRLDDRTYFLIFSALFTWLIATSPASQERVKKAPLTHSVPSARVALMLFAICYLCFAFEVIIAGFVPIVSLLLSGDSGYGDFGIPGLHGAFLAYVNALGVAALYCYLQTKRRFYFGLYLSVFGILIATMTRQNMLTLLIESIIVGCFVRKPIKTRTMSYVTVAVVFVFSAIGELRSGDIVDIIRVAPEYLHLPKAVFWLYAYSYFNAMNLQNMILNSGAPFFDGSMLSSFLPTFLRPVSNHETFIVYANMTVTSYLDPVYKDVGFAGVVVITALIGLWTAKAFNRAIIDRSLVSVAIYACLYFCALMSFFTNFWFFLPIIFQIPFFFAIQRMMFKVESPG